MKRELIFSSEFYEFYEKLPMRGKEKIRYATAILETIYPVPTKFVKKLIKI